MTKPTIQEMFDKAVRGLAAQEWRRSTTWEGGTEVCVYLASNGDRCAWGHVDPEGTEGGDGNVYSLKRWGRGLAAILDSEGLGFAKQLQMAHDRGQHCDTSPLGVRNAFMALGQKCDLVWPEGC